MRRPMRMMLLFLACAGCLMGQEAPAVGSLTLVADRVWTGTRLRTGLVVEVARGRIVRMSPAQGDPLAGPGRVLHVAFLMPGLVLADSILLSGAFGEQRSLTPSVRALDGYDPYLPHPELKGSGITALYLSPGRGRLLAGQGAVVRPFPPGAEPWVVAGCAAVEASVSEAARHAAARWKPPVAPSADEASFKPAEPQFPQARAGAFLTLRKLLEKARGGGAKTVPLDPYTPDLRGLAPLLAGKVPLRIRAFEAADILRSVRLARRLHLPLVVVGATEAWKVARELGAIKAGVVLAMGVAPGGKLAPAPPFHAPRGEPNPRAAAILKEAGVALALVPPRPGGFRDLLWYAAQARVPGRFEEADILRAVTSGAAAVLGLGGKLGRLVPGEPADLTAFDQDPLSAAARPVLVMAGGHLLKAAPAGDKRPLALFVGSVHTARGQPLQPGVVLIEQGRIRAVGQELVIPAGARRIRLPNAHLVPGFIDAGGQAGVRSYKTDAQGGLEQGGPLGSLSLDRPPATLFDRSFPDVLPVARAGVTTLALAPGEGRFVSGVLSLVQPGAVLPAKSLLASVAGIVFDYSQGGSVASHSRSLTRTLTGGKRYAESWEKYEKALSEWKEKHPQASEKSVRRKFGKVRPPAPRDALSGHWEGTAEARGLTVKVTADLKLKGQQVHARFFCPLLPQSPVELDTVFAEGRLEFDLEVQAAKVHISLSVLWDELRGTWSAAGEGRGSIYLQRVSVPESSFPKLGGQKGGAGPKPGGKKPSASTGTKSAKPPKVPRKVPALEPFRPLFQRKIPAFLKVGRDARVARALLKVLRDDFELKTVLMGPRVVPLVQKEMQRLSVGYAATGAEIYKEHGVFVNPLLPLVEHKLPVMLRSGPRGDPRTLYRAAAYLVRFGLQPEDALKMITRWPALMLGISGRKGSIERGKDADLVILSGPPFSPGSRVLRVLAGGRFVDEEKKP